MKKLWMSIVILIMSAFVFVACGKSEEKESQTDADTEENEHINEEPEANVTEEISEDTEERTESESENAQSTNEESGEASLQEEYLKLLDDTKTTTDDMRENPKDGSTMEMKRIEGNIYDIWDGLLNDIYSDLEEQLSPEKMEDLRKEQREWLVYRDETAKEASLKYEGGTGEQLEYVATENNVTIERSYELVENYMN